MCGHQALDHNPQNEGINFCRYLIWGYLGPDKAKLWIFGNRPKWLEKVPYTWKNVKFVQKVLGASICTLQAHFEVLGQNPKNHYFSPLNLQPKCWYVPYGCKYSPQALFLKNFDFFGKNRMLFIPCSLLSVKNSLSSDDLKKVNPITFHGQNSDFGEIVAGRLVPFTMRAFSKRWKTSSWLPLVSKQKRW